MTTSHSLSEAVPNKRSSIVQSSDSGKRLDTYLHENIEGYSRTYFQKCIERGLVSLNGLVILKDGYKLKVNDQITLQFPEVKPLQGLKIDKELGVKVVFEHSDFLIVYKPAGLMVHAALSADPNELTLVDWLIEHFNEIAQVGPSERPGIVHRLDKDTSGIILIARNTQAHIHFSNMFKDREMEKNYIALVQGHPFDSGTIEYPILRDPAQGHRMTHKITYGKPSVTHYKVIEYLPQAALMLVHPITGRTHQIRVHFAALKHSIIGDKLYGTASDVITRQALHAYSLSFMYKGQYYSFSHGIPYDMQKALMQIKSQE